MGLRNAENGSQSKTFLVWIAIVRHLKFKLVTHENVLEFGTSELELFLSDMYILIRVCTFPNKLGFPTYRHRQIVILILETWVNCVLSDIGASHAVSLDELRGILKLQESFDVLLSRTTSLSWKDFAAAPQGDLNDDVEWAASRAKSLTTMGAAVSESSRWESALNQMEYDYLQLYKQIYGSQSIVVNLGQNPLARRVTSCGDCLQTLTKNGSLLWMLGHGRWLTPAECWISLGHPITEELQTCSHGAQSPFSVGRHPPSDRTHRSQMSQAGNAMHVAAYGGIVITILLRFGSVLGCRVQENQRDPESRDLCDLISLFRSKRRRLAPR
jgi:hypothetical protein